eukprot:UN21565
MRGTAPFMTSRTPPDLVLVRISSGLFRDSAASTTVISRQKKPGDSCGIGPQGRHKGQQTPQTQTLVAPRYIILRKVNIPDRT